MKACGTHPRAPTWFPLRCHATCFRPLVRSTCGLSFLKLSRDFNGTLPSAHPRQEQPDVARDEVAREHPGPLEEAHFEAMLQQLVKWHRLYYSTIVPRNALDGKYLATWISESTSSRLPCGVRETRAVLVGKDQALKDDPLFLWSRHRL